MSVSADFDTPFTSHELYTLFDEELSNVENNTERKKKGINTDGLSVLRSVQCSYMYEIYMYVCVCVVPFFISETLERCEIAFI